MSPLPARNNSTSSGVSPRWTLDTAFGVDGVVLVDFYAASDGAVAAALAPDGGIIVVGTVRNGTRNQFGMVRINP